MDEHLKITIQTWYNRLSFCFIHGCCRKYKLVT